MSVIGGQITFGIGPSTTKSIEHFITFGLDASPPAISTPIASAAATLRSGNAASVLVTTGAVTSGTLLTGSTSSRTLETLP